MCFVEPEFELGQSVAFHSFSTDAPIMKAHKPRAAALVTFLAITVCLFTSWSVLRAVHAGEDGLQSVLVAAKKRALSEKYLFRYKFSKGEVIRWKVRQLGTTEATVHGNTQTSKMRSVSTKQWEIIDIDDQGNATFIHSVVDVDMWQKISDRQEVRYNSSKDKTPPPEYVQVAKTVGVPIATVKVSSSGEVLERDKAPKQANSGLGDIVLRLPREPVKVGQSWHLSNEIRVRRQDGKRLRVKTRLVYTLKSVKTGVATILVKTEVITPVNDPQVKSQLVQQLTNGELKFDLDAGRVLSQQIDWDETVVGFSGSDSLMKYLARFTEELIPADAVATQPDGPAIR